MMNCIGHFKEKLEKLQDMMKTQTGREMARERTERLKLFSAWFEEEHDLGQAVCKAVT